MALMTDAARNRRKDAVRESKRAIILEAALRVFEREGLDGASMRAIGDEAGYTAAAIYFHFDSKEAVYSELLSRSLDRLIERVEGAVASRRKSQQKLEVAALALFDFYAENPRDLDLGFYLFRGGIKPRGIAHDVDAALNAKLAKALGVLGAALEELGAPARTVQLTTADLFAHAVGLLLLQHTGRIRMFGNQARKLMQTHIVRIAEEIGKRS
ncbi:MAG: TetR/AcrR family transcriptional regulator [Hyphomicrobiaceae bacterium]